MHASRPRGLDPSGSARTQVDTCHCSANRLMEPYSDIRRSYRSAHLSERSGKPRPQRRHTCTWRSRTLTLMRYAACTAECMPTRAIGDILRSKRSDTVWPDEPLGRLSPAVATALRFALRGLLGLGPVLLAETGILVAAIPGITGLTFALLAVAVSPGLFCGSVLLIVPLLFIRSTRSLGIGLAVGGACSCGLVWRFVTYGYFNRWFGQRPVCRWVTLPVPGNEYRRART